MIEEMSLKELKKRILNECCDNCNKILKKGRGVSLDVWGFNKEPITVVLIFCSEKCKEEYFSKYRKSD